MEEAGKRVLAVVPARGGSKGLPGKNLLPLAGAPLIAATLRFAASLPEIHRVVVSTDDDAIAAAARDHGADVPFRRPAELAADDTPMGPVLRHALAEVEAVDGPYDALVLLMPTTPVRRAVDLRAGLARLWAGDADGVVSVSEPPFHPAYVGVRDGVPLRRYFAEGAGTTRRQEAGRFLRITGQFYVWRTGFVRRLERSWLDEGRHESVETDDAAALDVDTRADYDRLVALLDAGLVRLEP